MGRKVGLWLRRSEMCGWKVTNVYFQHTLWCWLRPRRRARASRFLSGYRQICAYRHINCLLDSVYNSIIATPKLIERGVGDD
jgi:hypothetical protein